MPCSKNNKIKLRMVGKKKATKSLWTQSSLTPSIQAYFDAYMGEFSTDWVQSDYPYKGKSSLEFRRISKVDRYDEDIRFCLLYTSPSPRDVEESRMPSSA